MPLMGWVVVMQDGDVIRQAPLTYCRGDVVCHQLLFMTVRPRAGVRTVIGPLEFMHVEVCWIL